MKIFYKTILLIGCLSTLSCASQSGWTPTVDPYGDNQSYRIDQDLHECKSLALKASGGTAEKTATGVGIGSLIGAASGALFGVFTGNAGSGALIGAAIGGVGGGITQGAKAEQGYKRAYTNCIQQRGHHVIY